MTKNMTTQDVTATLVNGIAVMAKCEEAVKNSTSYREALAQVEGIVLAAWGGEQDELSKSICDNLWLTYHV